MDQNKIWREGRDTTYYRHMTCFKFQINLLICYFSVNFFLFIFSKNFRNNFIMIKVWRWIFMKRFYRKFNFHYVLYLHVFTKNLIFRELYAKNWISLLINTFINECSSSMEGKLFVCYSGQPTQQSKRNWSHVIIIFVD